ncbi:MAG: methyltransferase domain-containing protein [Phaeodactylibacter sp.]|nr:methyltransferase domain-containing protein [Phaeodactylibacter sp.]
MPTPHPDQVRAFFDRIADTYPQRYTGVRPFHRQLFGERLKQAVTGRDFTQKTVLDIGAGTGALYDYLADTQTGFDYYACDISEKMLARSRIPEGRRFVGQVYDSAFPVQRFDYIFALGLTTYLTREELSRLLAFLPGRLSTDGVAIISYTHARSMEWRMRRLLRPLFRRLGLRRHLLGQPFEVTAYTPEAVKEMLPPGLQITQIHWLSPTLPLFSRFFPQAGAALARRLAPILGNKVYSDFLMEISRPMPLPNNLLLIAYYFPPVRVVGAVRLYHFYREARKHFGQVQVLSSTNRLRMVQDESLQLEGVAATEVPAYDLRRLTLKKGSENTPHLSRRAKDNQISRFLRRLADSFPLNILLGDGGLAYILLAYWQGRRLVRKHRITHLFSSFRPYSDHLVAWLLKRRFPHLFWIADFRDLHVDPVRRNTLCPSFQRWCNRQILRRADLVTAVSGGLKRQLDALAPRVEVLRNGIAKSDVPSDREAPFELFTIAYTGSLYESLQTAAPLLEAIRQLFREGALARENIRLLYAGKDGALWDEWLRQYGLEDIGLNHGLIPRAEARTIQRRARLNLLLSWTLPGGGGILTAKVYEYLAAGRPVLAIVNGERDEELAALLAGHYLLHTSQADIVPALKLLLLNVSGRPPEAPRPLPEGVTWEENMAAFVRRAL